MSTYKIVRFYGKGSRKRQTIRTGLTYEQAVAHCNDPETSSETCTNAEGKRRTRLRGWWFDGYEREPG